MPLTISDLMSKMPGAFFPKRQWDWMPSSISNSQVQNLANGTPPSKMVKCAVAQGVPASSPKMTLTADSADYVKIFTGELDGMQAFMQGKLKLGGDLNLAMKLMQMFKIR